MYDEETCDYLWEQFYNWAKGKEFSDSAKKVDQIHIMYEDGGAIERIEKSICYKKENYMKKGWCRTLDWKFTHGWGICSESCNYLKDVSEGLSGTVFKVENL